jgi:hypothetical protein
VAWNRFMPIRVAAGVSKRPLSAIIEQLDWGSSARFPV